MATQFTDGTFSETKPFEEALEDFKGFAYKGLAKAFHVGSEEEVEQLKSMEKQNRSSLAARVAELEKSIDELVAEQKTASKFKTLDLKEPTVEEIEKYCTEERRLIIE